MSRARDIANLQSSKITADFGIDIDNINIDGTEIDLSSGILTIDVAEDIVFDSGHGDFYLKDTGSTFLNIYESSDHAYLYNPRSNGDIIFQGNGVSEALRLDMSASGAATFNSSAIFGSAIAVGQSSLSGGSVIADFHTSGNAVGTQLAFANDHNTDKFFVGLEGNTTGNAMIYQQKNADINFYTNNSLQMTLDSSGNVGIGTSSPATSYGRVLQIHDTGTSGANLRLTDSNSGSGTGNGLELIQIGSAAYVFNRESGAMQFGTSGTEQMRISSGGNVGIGESNPDRLLHLTDSACPRMRFTGNGSDGAGNVYAEIEFENAEDAGAAFTVDAAIKCRSSESNGNGGELSFFTGVEGTTAERIRIKADGNVGISTTAPQFKLHVNKGSGTYGSFSGVDENIVGFQTSYSADSPQILTFSQLDGNWVDGTSGADSAFGWLWGYQNQVRGGLIYDHRGSERMQMFSSYGTISFITPDSVDGDAVPTDSNMTERLVIAPGGNVSIGKTAVDTSTVGTDLYSTGLAVFVRDNALVGLFNRLTSDGDLISFRQAGTEEGTISVSSNTVSYNGFSGLHESSGIASNIPVGTVCSTIDELDVYPNTQSDGKGGTEEHPKKGQTRADHAKIKVSDTEGDKRVYGVLQRYNDQSKPLIASVGIGSIRVTGACEGGDLLESNGDGTAKVQSDDIIRSKTIGKVTIGNSDTGVKLVSCVLYCG